MRGMPPPGDPARVGHSSGVCGTTGKLRFRTRKKALKAPNGVGQRRSAYVCQFCESWHVTTQEQRS